MEISMKEEFSTEKCTHKCTKNQYTIHKSQKLVFMVLSRKENVVEKESLKYN